MARSADDRAERPDRAAVAIVGAGAVFPSSRVRHEVPESPALGLECVTHEREVPRRERAHELGIVSATVLRERHQEQSACIVVETVAFLVAGNTEVGVLEDAGVIGHQAQVLEVDLG
jgi:hypothetical protein